MYHGAYHPVLLMMAPLAMQKNTNMNMKGSRCTPAASAEELRTNWKNSGMKYIGTKVAVEAQAIQEKRISIVLDFRNSIGKMRWLWVVKIEKDCCSPKRMNRTPEVMKRPMVRPDDQA